MAEDIEAKALRTVPRAGNPEHPDHEAWLLELGRATYAASRVAGVCFDIARVFGRIDSAAMYNDPLGTLINRLRPISKEGSVPGLVEFIDDLENARQERNDLLHALPVADGLYRRKTHDLSFARSLYDIDDLASVTEALNEALRRGSELLYHDAGAAVRAWHDAQCPVT